MKTEDKAALLIITSLILAGFAVGNQDENTSVSVSVSDSCQIGLTEFKAPGNTSTDVPVLGLDETGSFFAVFYNYGNVRINASVWLNVTKEDNFWQPGDDVGNAVDLTEQNNTENVVNNSFYSQFSIVNDTVIYNTSEIYLQTYHTVPDYGPGNFTGRMYIEYSCKSETENLSRDKYMIDHANFVVLDVPGQSGGVNTTGNQTAPPVAEDINQSGESNATVGDGTGNDTTDVTQPENYSELGNQTVNQTYPFPGNMSQPGPEPEDVNKTGDSNATVGNKAGNNTSEITQPENYSEIGNQTVNQTYPFPGDSDEPGETPEPTPGDSPEAGQSDTPKLQIDVEPTEDIYYGTQGKFSAARLEIENVGERVAENIEISPEIQQIRENWSSRSAQVESIEVNQTLTRDVFVRPPENQEPGRYVIPIEARNEETTLDLDYFTLSVNRSEFIQSLRIQEAPESVLMNTNATQNLPVLIENTGETELKNIRAEIQNVENCGRVSASGIDNLGINESKSMNLVMDSFNQSQECSATLIVSSEEGAYSFTDIEFTIAPDEGLIPEQQRAPILAILWTVILAAFAVVRKKYDLTSPVFKIPFILLIVGETVILLYMVVNYYGIFTVSFLPF